MYSESPSEQKPIKNLGENGACAYTGSAQIFCVPPIISGTDKAADFKFGRYIHRVHSTKSPLKFWEKMERGRIQGLPKFFEYPLSSQERVKLRTSNFVRTLLVSIGTKVHYKFRKKLAGCVVRTLKTFQGTHILGASRGLLCDSSAVLFLTARHHSLLCRALSQL